MNSKGPVDICFWYLLYVGHFDIQQYGLSETF